MSLLKALNSNLASIAGDTQNSLVYIENGRGQGAGTIWQQDGLIVTNAHVVANHRGLTVTTHDGTRFPAQVIAMNRELDLAAVAIEGNDLPTAAIGDSDALNPGDWVMAVGHPWGVRGAVTQGVVIGTGDELPERPAHGREWLAMSLHLRPGHSGGPVMNIDGELVGVNTIMAGPEVGIAVPSNVAKAFLKESMGSRAKRIPVKPRRMTDYV
ncbi:MAG: trypsin-like peptidase domain-containing protein [Chloroflexota bacterium]